MSDAEDGPVTVVTTLQVDPADVDEVLVRLRKVRDEVMVKLPDHLGVDIKVSLDRSKILVIGKWRSRAAVDAVLFNEELGQKLDYVTEKAKLQESVLYQPADD